MADIIPSRELNLLYIILDSVFLLIYLVFLLAKRKRMTVLVGALAAILYFVVDYVFFYKVTGSRTVSINGENATETQYFFYLLWHEVSSGFTNFTLLWLLLSKDKDIKIWVILVVGWWLLLPAIAELGGDRNIACARTTTSYHAPMAIIMAIGYLFLIIYNLFVAKNKAEQINIIRLFLIGFFVQFAWEGAFLLYGIRPWNENSIPTLLIDSLIETNLGMPYLYFIHKFVTSKRHEDFSRVALINEA